MAQADLFFKRILVFSIPPLSENEDRELYFALLTFKEFAFTAASWCKEIITAQSLGFSAKAQSKHTRHLSMIPSSRCLKYQVKSKPSALQPQPQAALRIPV